MDCGRRKGGRWCLVGDEDAKLSGIAMVLWKGKAMERVGLPVTARADLRREAHPRQARV